MFSISDVTTTEGLSGTTTFVFTITRDDPTGDASVGYTTVPVGNNPATPDEDFVSTSGRLLFTDGQTSQTISVTVNGDSRIEANETFNVVLTDPENDTIADGIGTGTILNDDFGPLVSIVAENGGVQLEGNSGTTAYTFSIILSRIPTEPVTVTYRTNDGTATLADNDYQANQGTLIFEPGTRSQAITILVNGDTQSEATETFTVSLESAINAVINPDLQVATGTIVNDELVYTVTPSPTGSMLVEGNSGTTSRTFVITRTGNTTQASTLNFALTGDATQNTDYTAVVTEGNGISVSGNTIQFAAGATSAVITVAVQGDTQVEADENIILTLTDPAGVAIINGSSQLTTIINDDVAPTLPIVSISASDANAAEAGSDPGAFTISRAGGDTSTPLTVSYTIGGTATNGVDYTPPLTGTATIPAGQLAVVIPIPTVDDLAVEPDESVILTLTDSPTYDLGTASATVTIADNDILTPPPSSIVSIIASDPNAAEIGNDSGTFTISRSGDTSAALTVNYTISGTATSGIDYTSLVQTATIPAGQSSVEVIVLPIDDTDIEGNETVSITLTDSSGYDVGVATATVTIADNDALPPPPLPTVRITATDPEAAEAGNDTGTFTISRTGNTSEALTVTYTVGGTATSGTDYATLEQTVTIPAGQSSVEVTVLPADDSEVEGSETVNIALIDSSGYDLDVFAAGATVTIADNDALPPPPLPTVSITATDPSAAEAGSDTGTFTISRTGDTSTPLTVSYTIGGTASNGVDYTPPLTNTVTVPAGQLFVNIPILPVDDLAVEPDESVILTLTDSTTYDLGTAAATVTIADNDGLPTVSIDDISLSEGNSGTTTFTFTVNLSAPSNAPVTVEYAATNNTALVGTDYTAAIGLLTFAPGQTSQKITVEVQADPDVEGDETFFVNLSNLTGAIFADAQGIGTILNDDVPPPLPTVSINDAALSEGDRGNTLTFTVSLSAPSSTPVTVEYATADGSAIAPSDYTALPPTTLTFAPGQTSQTITVNVQDDLAVEGDETFFVNLSNATGATINDAQGLGTILNDDVDLPPPLPTLSIDDVSLSEGNSGITTFTFTVNLSAASSDPVTVQYATADNTALAGTDYTTALGQLTFAPVQTSQTITVGVSADLDVEGNETFFVNLSNATGAILTDAQGLGAILNDDVDLPPPLPTLSIDQVSLSEGNSGTTTFTFTVSLSAASNTPIAVEYATADGSATALSDYTAIPLTTLTFAPGQTSQSITVNIQGDLDVEASETFVVNLSNATGATIAVAQGTGTILNDDVPVVVNAPPVAIADQGSVTEGQAVTIAVLANDSDPDGDPLAIDSFTNPQFGTVIRNNDGTFTYQANLDFAGTDSFTYQISDGQSGVSSAAVSITVNPLDLVGTDCCDHLVGTNTGNRIEGRSGNDWIEGRGGNDWLNGESGWDTLIGGTGADRFVFASNSAFTPCSLGVDTIVDFDRSQGDAIVLSKTTFTALSSLVGDSLNADDFVVINSACNGATLAAASVARIVFNQATGDLFYNQNGSCCGFGSGGQFATLSTNSSTRPLQATDFRVIA